MRKWFNTPLKKIIGIMIALGTIMVLRLFMLTVIDGKEWRNLANSSSIRGIYNSSPRGSIYDRNGKVLATNKQIFSVRMSAGNMKNDQINKVAGNLINLLEKNKESLDVEFPIEYDKGKFRYTFYDEVTKWLRENDLDESLTAEQAFMAMKDKLDIDTEDRYEAQKEMQTKYNIYPPISVKDMTYRATAEKKKFLKSYGLDEDLSAKEAFEQLRDEKKFDIDSKMSIDRTLKIMGIRNSMKALGYQKYMPATIAKDVSSKTVIEIEEAGDELKGVEVTSESKRVYPNDNLGSHILGYMGKISASEKAEYEAKGYETSALVGKEGIEGKYESVLKGRDGAKIVRVNAKGDLVSTLQKIEPKKGKDIYLTIDSDLQKVAQEGLAKNIKAIRSGGNFSSEFGSIGTKAAPKAKTGAVVAIDVKSGDVLALASYPDYNPNLFAEGISPENWSKLQSSNPRDSLSEAPLLNLATMSAVQPGSTFKPVTALSALENGLNPNKIVKDGGAVKLGGRTFGCILWNTTGGNHGYIDMYKAMAVSCNYYFYDLATNRDWASNKSLGLNKEMGTESIVNMAKRLGLNDKTGIELNEVATGVPTEKAKIDGLKRELKNALYANAESYFTKEVYSNIKRLDKDINTIVSWMGTEKITYAKMKDEYLPQVGIKKEKYNEVTELCLYEYFNQAKWTIGDAFNISIGQGSNSYTPIQMANYMATLGNNGKLNQASIVKSIEDEGDTVKKSSKDANISQRYIDEVKKAMYAVSRDPGSGISAHYKRFPWEVSVKTGTAQKSGFINPKSEIEYIKKNLRSFGNMTWSEVETEMKRLMKEYPKIYSSQDTAVRRAVINLSGGKITYNNLDRFKQTYDEFAWTVALAPRDNPKIAVACMIPQGVTGGNANPVVREIIGQYLKSIGRDSKDFKIVNEFN